MRHKKSFLILKWSKRKPALGCECCPPCAISNTHFFAYRWPNWHVVGNDLVASGCAVFLLATRISNNALLDISKSAHHGPAQLAMHCFQPVVYHRQPGLKLAQDFWWMSWSCLHDSHKSVSQPWVSGAVNATFANTTNEWISYHCSRDGVNCWMPHSGALNITGDKLI